MRTTTRKSLLLASAAVVAIGMGVLSKPAAAFDEVNWSWDKTVTENVLKDVTVTIDTAPSGMVELEKIQMQIGDVNATSTVTNIANNPPGEDGTQPAPAPEPAPQIVTIDLGAYYKDQYYGDDIIKSLTLKEGTTEGVELVDGQFEGTVDERDNKIWLAFDLTVPPVEGEPAPAPDPNQIPIGERLGIDLPKVASAATAVGNNQDIESSVSLELHDAQYLFGGFGEPDTDGTLASLFEPAEGSNSHTNALASLVSAGSLGLITPASVTADSTVTGILNATVDSNATAVGNNMSIDLAAFTPDDAFVIADATQFSYANVTATSLVDDVTIDGYSELGAAGLGPCGGCLDETGLNAGPQIPTVNSVATAVGNNFSLKVSSPEL